MSPAHQTLASKLKRIDRQPFSELVTKLYLRVDTFDMNLQLFNLSTKLMIRNADMLGARCQLWHTSKLQASIVIFIDHGLWNHMRRCPNCIIKSLGVRMIGVFCSTLNTIIMISFITSQIGIKSRIDWLKATYSASICSMQLEFASWMPT